ncbi:hypothetical protein Cgig2_016574 [Carnegiea gigantea]|uniref:RING-type E3 ubiquitin transferase n=1 Tax=Carnegiea gigantea TaxID=171969 RepID=A0A9Q1QQW6_9CARY|nr:hypothetical protein Cgig2_016574 [Carnegiea gigantea]
MQGCRREFAHYVVNFGYFRTGKWRAMPKASLNLWSTTTHLSLESHHRLNPKKSQTLSAILAQFSILKLRFALNPPKTPEIDVALRFPPKFRPQAPNQLRLRLLRSVAEKVDPLFCLAAAGPPTCRKLFSEACLQVAVHGCYLLLPPLLVETLIATVRPLVAVLVLLCCTRWQEVAGNSLAIAIREIKGKEQAYLRGVKVPFQEGAGQRFRQPSGTGVNLRHYDVEALGKPSADGASPLVIFAEVTSSSQAAETSERAQITHAVIERQNDGSFNVKVIKQIVSIDGEEYEVRELYGIGSSSAEGFNDDDPGKECVICMTEPKNTAVMPCRHLCMCSDCAKELRLQTKKCPICREEISELIEIKINDASDH